AILLVIRGEMAPETFASWGWRIPFIISIVLLAFSIYIRLKLQESPVFLRIKSENRASSSPLSDSFLKYPNNKLALLALLGVVMGEGVVWYTGQFWALFFLGTTLKLDYVEVYLLIGASLIIGTPFFIVFGRLSDRIGRLKIILAGCLIAAVTYIPIFKAMTHYVNPALETFQENTKISVASDDCNLHIFVGPWTKNTPCDVAKDFFAKSGLSFDTLPGVEGQAVVVKVGDAEFKGWSKDI